MQGATNVTRMDYASPLSNELVFSIAVERLLDLELPERATWIRMLLVELNRMSSHLLFQATNGMDLGAVSMMIYGWREREYTLRLLETHHRPADEPQLHPPRWRRRRPARRLAGRRARALRAGRARRRPSTTRCCSENPIWRERTVGVGVITTRGGARARRDRSDPAVDRLRVGPAQGAAVPRVRRRRLRRDLHRERRRLRPLPDPPLRDPRVDQDRAPVRGAHARAATTACRTARSRRRRVRASTSRWKRSSTTSSSSPRASACRAGETYVAVESPRGEIGCYLVSDGTAKPIRLHIRGPSFYNLQSMDAMVPGGMFADAVAIVSSIDPIMGEVDR